tara:strand:+ start:296 stop:994 length:699 start_codon:yes stop_codon:yes gene_type:complete
MKLKFLIALTTLTFSLPAFGAQIKLTEEQKAKGWRMLFNGKNLDGWRSYNKGGKIGDAWQVKNETLTKIGGSKGGNIMTAETFGDFDLNWDWRVEKNGNNGIKYMITEDRKAVIGHEYQMIDDINYAKGKGKPKSLTASFYDVLPPDTKGVVKKPGEWNHSRIFVLGDTVEHWLNGKMVLQYNLGSKEVLDAVQNSKFKKVKGFGTKVRGHIVLTDHKDMCQFKNIRIREFK